MDTLLSYRRLARLDAACVEKFGHSLDQLNTTSLKKVIAAYQLKVEAGIP